MKTASNIFSASFEINEVQEHCTLHFWGQISLSRAKRRRIMEESHIQWFLKRSGQFETPFNINLDKSEIFINRSHPFFKGCIQISRKHAYFQKTIDDKWYLKDMDSTNGLYVNTLKIAPFVLHPIQCGDKIGFGIPHGESENEFEFELCCNSCTSSSETGNLHPANSINHFNAIGSHCQGQNNVQLQEIHTVGLQRNDLNSVHIKEECDIDCFSQSIQKDKFCNSLNINDKVCKPYYETTGNENINQNEGQCVSSVSETAASSALSSVKHELVKCNQDCPIRAATNHHHAHSVSCNAQEYNSNLTELHSNSSNVEIDSKEHCSFENTKVVVHNKVKDASCLHTESFEQLHSFKDDNGSKLPFKINDSMHQDSDSVIVESDFSEKDANCKETNINNSINKDRIYQKLKKCSIVLEKCDDFLLHGQTNKNTLKNNIRKNIVERNLNSDDSDDSPKFYRRRPNNIIYSSSSDEDSALDVSDEIGMAELSKSCIKQSLLSTEGTSNKRFIEDCILKKNNSADLKEDGLRSDDMDLDNLDRVSIKDKHTPVLHDLSSLVKEEPKDDVICYSQQDEVIVISDDDEYISSSQKTHEVKIKTEPFDEYDMNWQAMFQDDDSNSGISISEDTENVNIVTCSTEITSDNADVALEYLASDEESDNKITKLEENDSRSENCNKSVHQSENNFKDELNIHKENIENLGEPVREFDELDDIYVISDDDDDGGECDISHKTNYVTDNELLTRIHWADDNEEMNDVKTPSTETKCVNDFFPASFEMSDSSASSPEDKSSVPITKIQNDKDTPISKRSNLTSKPQMCVAPIVRQIDNESYIKKCKKKSGSLLTDALPMPYRPKYKRGREEWFCDRYTDVSKSLKNIKAGDDTSHLSVPNSSYNTVNNQNLNKKEAANKKEVTSVKKNKNKTRKLKDLVMRRMKHRIPIPGGGSDFIMQDAKSIKISDKDFKHNSFNNCDREKKTKSVEHSIMCEKPQNKQQNEFKNKQQKDRFASRLSSLVEDVKKSSLNKTKKQNKTGKNSNVIKANSSLRPNFSNFKIPKIKETVSSLSANQEKEINCNELATSVPVTVKETSVPLIRDSLAPRNTLNNLTLNNKKLHEDKVQSSTTFIQSNIKKHEPTTSIGNKKRRVTFSEEVTKHVFDYPEHSSGKDSWRNQNLNKKTPNIPPTYNSKSYADKFSKRNPIPSQNVYKKPYGKVDDMLDNAMLKILTWNVQWLKEQESISAPPPILNSSPKSVKLIYDTYDNYINTYYPLLLLDLWDSLFENSKNAQSPELLCLVSTYKTSGKFLTLDCQTFIDNHLFAHVCIEGSLLIMDLRSFNDTAIRSLGYVYECKSDIFRPETLPSNSRILNHPYVNIKNNQFLNFKIKTKHKTFSIDLKKLMKFRILYYLKPTLRRFEALLAFPLRILHGDIMAPRMNTFSFIGSDKELTGSSYNQSQRATIHGAVDVILRPYPIPQIVLLQGPPGTGKTSVLLGIIHQLFHNKRDDVAIKLLVTAPSNAAVDEIGLRLVNERNNILTTKGRKLRFVRVGQYNHIHHDLKMFSLEDLLKKNLEYNSEMQEKDYDDKICELKAKLLEIELQIKEKKRRNLFADIVLLQRQLAISQKRIEQYKFEKSNVRIKVQPSNDAVKYKVRNDILTKADVILSTLSSCRQSAVEKAFHVRNTSDVGFTCCIVDEATQCTEPDILIPLFYNMSKLVLIGDPCQLPATVVSREAEKYGLQISLFERLQNYFEGAYHNQSPVFMLTEQYRMHPTICEFPSKYFYSGRLTTSNRLLGTYQPFPLKPYIVFDLVNGLETNKTSKINYPEIQFVLTIINCLEKELQNRYTKGIITPYQEQRRIYSEHLSKLNLKTVEVNTIDGFQGREKDVIILSCVRAKSHNGTIGFLANKQRLNVAITRARYSLIICGHLKTLEDDPHWKCLINDAHERNLVVTVNSEVQSLDLMNILLKIP